MELGVRQEFNAQRGQGDIFIGRETAHGDRAHNLAIFRDGNSTTPADVPGIAVVGNVVGLLWMLYLFANFFGGFALARRGPGLVGCDLDGRDGSAIHAREADQIAVGIGHGHRCGLLHLRSFFHDEIHGTFGFGVVDGLESSHERLTGMRWVKKIQCWLLLASIENPALNSEFGPGATAWPKENS
jgi:hypothetical protein